MGLPALAVALQYAPAAVSAISGLYGMFNNPYKNQGKWDPNVKMPGQDDYYKSIERMSQAISPERLNATAAQTDSINQMVSDRGRSAQANFAGNTAGMERRIAQEGQAAKLQAASNINDQFRGEARQLGGAAHASDRNKAIWDLQQYANQREQDLMQKLGALDMQNQAMGALSSGLSLAGSEMESNWQNYSDDPEAKRFRADGGLGSFSQTGDNEADAASIFRGIQGNSGLMAVLKRLLSA